MNPTIKPAYKYSELTGKIIGCAMEVHKILGPGFPEKIYQRALAQELTIQGLSFRQEFYIPIQYKNQKIGSRRVDFLIEEKISTEIKATSALDDLNLNQALNYLEAYHLEVGLLINFGAKSLQFKRLINSKIKER